MEGNIEGNLEVNVRRGRILQQPQVNWGKRRVYWKLKREAVTLQTGNGGNL